MEEFGTHSVSTPPTKGVGQGIRITGLIAFITVLSVSSAFSAPPDGDHQVYFEQTDYELHVYRIFGREPGKTVLIIGGIHGNEPGAYLAADRYVDLSLRRGNLIIVPRANLLAILANDRGLTGDYNRKFNADLKKDNLEDQVIVVLKQLIRESDVLLNLHDGSGFFRSEYIDSLHNPYRFGQSIIVDCENYSLDDGSSMPLGEIARRVVEKVNSQIEDEQFHFSYNNHDSLSPGTRYPEMRRTATFFALTKFKIPAFGVETSKNLPQTELRVDHQVLAINAFLQEFGVEVDLPGGLLEEPRLDYAVVCVNGRDDYVVRNGGTLKVRSGDRIKIDHLVGNYDRLLVADIVGYEGRNDNGKEVAVTRPLTVRVNKDSDICGQFQIAPQASEGDASGVPAGSSTVNFLVEVNGRRWMVGDGGELEVLKGDGLRIVDYIAPSVPKGINVNFLGFVGNQQNNRGEDRGYLINTAVDLLTDWSLDGDGKRYAVAVKLGQAELARMTVVLVEPRLDYIVVSRNGERPVVLQPGDRWHLHPGDRLRVLGIHTNAPDEKAVSIRAKDSDGKLLALEDDGFLSTGGFLGQSIILSVLHGDVELGSVSLVMSAASAPAEIESRR